ncbi:hypothetical protein RB595_000801 [Gaeumannomyces hyphopodioides]
MERAGTVSFEWTLNNDKVRDGRYGPVFLALNNATGQLLAAERLDLDLPALATALAHLDQTPGCHDQEWQQHTLPYFGYQRRGDHTYVLTGVAHGGTLSDFLEPLQGAVPMDLARNIIRSVAKGVDGLRTARGLSAVLPDARHVWIDHLGNAKVEAPLLDVAMAGQMLPPALLSLPELVVGGADGLRKADGWLLGVIAAQVLSGRPGIVADYASATSVGAEISRQGQITTALEILVPDREVALPKDQAALDFLCQCLTVRSDQRPGLSQLRDHAFLRDGQ